MISVVSPFYNEEAILENAVTRMLSNLERLDREWELVIVNDGSTDNSLGIAQHIATRDARIRIVTYKQNRGRGYALKQGIQAAAGDIIVTTEADCSWGDDIVAHLVRALEVDPKLDIVIASTNLPGGGYVNVPANRVLLSRGANFFLGLTVSNHITMFTGMTRGYRAAVIKRLPISEYGKEFHLDVVVKAVAFGLKIGEIPATITWQDDKLARADVKKRKSSSKVPSLIRSHFLFGLSGRPYRYLFLLGGITLVLTSVFFIWGVVNLLIGAVSIYLLSLALSCFILTILFSGIGVLALQQNAVLRELWMTRRELAEMQNK